jgi:hypothetical protein
MHPLAGRSKPLDPMRGREHSFWDLPSNIGDMCDWGETRGLLNHASASRERTQVVRTELH